MYSFTNYELNTIDKGWKYYHRYLKLEKTEIKEIRVCIYLRKSTEDVKDNSLKLQIKEINHFIDEINLTYQDQFRFYYENADVYSEDNVSGMQGRMRPEFNRMLNTIEDSPGYYGVCIVYKMDRFSRKLEDTLNYISLLKVHKCVLKALDFDDNGDPTSDLLKNILGVVAQYHAQNSAYTSIKGTMKKVEEHKTVGLLPLGYISEKSMLNNSNIKGATKILIDESKSIIIKEIYEKYLSGMSIKEIEKYLKSKFYTNNNGSFISYQQIKYILQNKKYNGTYVYADPNRKRYYKYDNGVRKPDYYEQRNVIPKIIDDDMFNKVQKMIMSKKNSHQLSGEFTVYLLSGLLVCGCCGSKLHGWSRSKYQGKKYYDYVCIKHKNKDVCSTKMINKNYIENYILDLIVVICNLILKDNKNLFDQIINKKYDTLISNINNLKNEISKKQNQIDKLINRILIDDKNTIIYETKINSLNIEMEELKKRKEELHYIYNTLKEQYKTKLKRILITKELLNNKIQYTKLLLNLIIKEITLTNQEINIVFNLKNQ